MALVCPMTTLGAFCTDGRYSLPDGGGRSERSYHEPINEISGKALDTQRQMTSLTEVLEAVDWTNQRVDACKCAKLKGILSHNRDEGKNTRR